MVKTNDASPAAKEVADYRAAIWEGYTLVKEKDLINTPILYLSKYIIRNKLEYYKLL